MARPTQRLFHLVFEPHNGRALVPIPERSASPRATSNTAVVDGLKVLDPKRPIREADIRDKVERKEKCRRCCQSVDGLSELSRHFSCLPEHGCWLIGLVMKQHAQRELVRPWPTRRHDDADAGPSLGNLMGQI